MKPLSKREPGKKWETYLYYKGEFLKRKQEMLSPVKEEFPKELGIPRTMVIRESGNKVTITSGLTHPEVLTSLLDSKKKKLNVSINLEAPNWLIDVILEHLLNYTRKREGIKEKTISFYMLETYLKIFDLNAEGKSPKEIAKEVYPVEYRRGQYGTIDSLIKKVKRNIEEAKGIVESGGKII
jgi:hypothetical protein